MTDHNQLSVVPLIDQIIYEAVNRGASDIHFEPMQEGLRVRFRLDGILHDYMMVNSAAMAQCVSRIKVIAHIDIAEKRVPHDGKFSLFFE